MPNLRYYISTLDTRLHLLETRFKKNTGFESNGVRLLRSLLNISNYSELLKLSDRERYKQLLIKYDELTRVFDPVVRRKTYSGMFIAPGNGCREYLIPVKMTDGARQYPLGMNWSEWESLTPVRMIDNNTNELSFHIYNDNVVYKNSPPTTAVFTIDVIGMILQFLKYRETFGTALLEPAYFHKYVLTRAIMRDIAVIWLRNQYIHVMTKSISREDARNAINFGYMSNNIYGYVDAHYPKAIEELSAIIRDVKYGTIRVETALQSFRSFDGGMSDYYLDLMPQLAIPNQTQYRWVEYLRDLPWVLMVAQLASLFPSHPDNITTVNAFKRDIVLGSMGDLSVMKNSVDRYTYDLIMGYITRVKTALIKT